MSLRSLHLQDQVQQESLRNPEAFWSHQAEQLHWHRAPSRALSRFTKQLDDGTSYPSFSWFPDGEISTCFNCLDRHVLAGNGSSTAMIWDSPVTGSKERYTYSGLLSEVEALAGVLREEGVKKGDVVLIYMPMIPAALIALLAISRLGAIHTVVFGGFAPVSLAQRIDSSRPRAIMTASCGVEGAKGPLNYKPFVEEALERSAYKLEKVLIWQRAQSMWAPVEGAKGERDWQCLVDRAKSRGLKADCVPISSNDGLYIIYTSGSTGEPKGVLREVGGHAVGLNFSIRYIFGIHAQDVMFCASDIGWVVGHSYILYGPLLAGATTVLFEGKPVKTPNAGTFWRILSEYQVKTLFTAPTALRAIRGEDPRNEYFTKAGQNGALKSLQGLFVAGERSEPSLIRMYQKLLDLYCAPGAKVIDNWWSSESGSPISALSLCPQAGRHFNAARNSQTESLPTKPGSAGKPMPGFDVRVVSDGGDELPRGQLGNIVLAIPLGPTGFTTLFNQPQRFYNGYLKRFNGRWIDTGDAGIVDEDGYIHVMARSDDIINVAAHRFSTGAIEQIIASHPDVAECCVVGIPDALKGHLPFAFITPSTTEESDIPTPTPQRMSEIQKMIREQIGAVAALGGLLQGRGMIPRTKSGKSLRRVLRELLENAVHGDFDKDVAVPATIEDTGAVQIARQRIRDYFASEDIRQKHQPTEVRAKL